MIFLIRYNTAISKWWKTEFIRNNNVKIKKKHEKSTRRLGKSDFMILDPFHLHVISTGINLSLLKEHGFTDDHFFLYKPLQVKWFYGSRFYLEENTKSTKFTCYS